MGDGGDEEFAADSVYEFVVLGEDQNFFVDVVGEQVSQGVEFGRGVQGDV